MIENRKGDPDCQCLTPADRGWRAFSAVAISFTTIDRNILRLGAFELRHRDDIPPKVTINEAIELGKRFSTANSGSFINGILDRVKNQHAAHKGDQSPESPPPGSNRPEEG